MRITQKMMDRGMLAEVGGSLERLAESQARMASQKKITKPSDSPGELNSLLAVKDQLSVSRRYRANISDALLRLQRADAGLTGISERLMKAKEIAVRVTGAMSGGTRTALAEELEGVIGSVLQELNSKDHGEFVFAGTASSAQPFAAVMGPDPDGAERLQSVTYAGNGSVRNAEVGAGQTAAAGVSGAEAAAPGAGGLLETLIGLRRAILDGSPAAALQDSLDAHMSRLDALQVRLGSAVSRLEDARESLGSSELEAEKRRSDIEDTDFTEEVLEQGRRQAEYEAVLSAAARRSKLSLINYI